VPKLVPVTVTRVLATGDGVVLEMPVMVMTLELSAVIE